MSDISSRTIGSGSMDEESIKKNIAANIAFFRKQKNITQAGLASLIGAKSTTISTWERGASLPDAETLFRICKVLSVSLSEIFGVDVHSSDMMSLTKREKEIIHSYRMADSVGKAMVERVLGISPSENEKEDYAITETA